MTTVATRDVATPARRRDAATEATAAAVAAAIAVDLERRFEANATAR
jgi:hypothetical protein